MQPIGLKVNCTLEYAVQRAKAIIHVPLAYIVAALLNMESVSLTMESTQIHLFNMG